VNVEFLQQQSLGQVNTELDRLRSDNKRLTKAQHGSTSLKRQRTSKDAETGAQSLQKALHAMVQGGGNVQDSKRIIAELACHSDIYSLAHALYSAMESASFASSVAIHESEILQTIMHGFTGDVTDRLLPVLYHLLSDQIVDAIASSNHLALKGKPLSTIKEFIQLLILTAALQKDGGCCRRASCTLRYAASAKTLRERASSALTWYCKLLPLGTRPLHRWTILH
jgi:hypothetical protein